MELTDEDREYIANQIGQGFTSGMTGSEEEDTDGELKQTRISWELKVNKWEE